MTRCRINRVPMVLLGALLATACATTRDLTQGSGAPSGFRQLPWGATPASELQRPLASVSADITVFRLPVDSRPRPLLGVPVAEEAYSFYKGRFFSGSAWLDGKDNFTRIKDALSKHYGEPAKQVGGYDRGSTTNEPQLKGYKDMWVWRWPDSAVEVRLSHHAIHDRATVTYINEAVRKTAAMPVSEPATGDSAAATR